MNDKPPFKKEPDTETATKEEIKELFDWIEWLHQNGSSSPFQQSYLQALADRYTKITGSSIFEVGDQTNVGGKNK